MNELVVADKISEWLRLKALVLDSISSPITRRVYNLGLDEFIAWYMQGPRPGFTKATVSAWRVALEAGNSAPYRSTSGGPPSGSWQSEPPTTGFWRRRWPRDRAHIKGVRAQGILTGNCLSFRQASGS